MNDINKQPTVKLHGECITVQNAILPDDAVKFVPGPGQPLETMTVNGKTVVVLANSETTGNHHVLDYEPEVQEFFYKEVSEPDGSKRKAPFMKASGPSKVACVLEHRHATEALDAGTYEFDIQQGYDYVAERRRAVRD